MPHVSQYSNADMQRIVAAIEAARGERGLKRALSAHGITAATFYRWRDNLAKSPPRGASRKISHPKPATSFQTLKEIQVEDLILEQIVSGDRGALIERIDGELDRLRGEIEKKKEAVQRIEAFRRMLAPAEKGASG